MMTPEEVVVSYEKLHPKFVDLTGQTFGRLTVVCAVKIEGHRTIRWVCQCSCGKEKIVRGKSLVTGGTR